MATKIIKLNNGQTGNNAVTYVPITLADAVQYTYESGAMSVQQAIGTLATSQISIAEHLHDQGTDLQTHSTSVTSNVGYITLSQNEDKVYIKNGGSSTASSTYAHVGITTEGTKGLILKVSYTDTQPNDKAIKIGGNIGTATQAFTTNSSSERTLTIKGSTNNPIQTTVSGNANSVTLTVDHAKQGPSASADTTVGQTSAVTIGVGDNKSFNVPTFKVNSYGHVTGASNTSVSVDLTGLTGAMHYKGKVDSLPTTLPGTYKTGDVIAYNYAEYVLEYENSTYAWRELGEESSHALKGTTTCAPGDGMTGTTMYAYVYGSNGSIAHAIPSGASAGKKDSATNNFIKSVTTDKFGHVTAYTTGTFTQSHYLSANTFGASKATNSAKTNGNVYLNHAEWNGSSYTYTSTHKITGTGNTYAYTDANGNLTIYTPSDIDVKTLQGGTNSTAYTAVEAGTGSATAATNDDTLTLTGANYWINVNASSKNVNIAHALASGANKNTQGLYTVKIDNAGHSYSATAQSSETIAIPTGVDINAIGFTVGKEVELNDDWVNAALGTTQTPVNPSGSLTTTNTTHEYWYKVTS